jgi:hypothetical protein
MSWRQVLLLCWVFYLVGFATAALMAAARDDAETHEALRSPGLNDD